MTVKTLMRARTLLLVGCVAALMVPFTALGGTSAKTSTVDATTQHQADLWQIDQIEVHWHHATSTHNIDEMMALWAPGAVFNINGQTLTGKAQIKHWFLTQNPAFHHHWESDTPTYKIRVTINGDKGTLYFQCHYIDTKTKMVVAYPAVDHKVQKINGKWLIVDSADATPELSP
jgi:ketosteroid isomerase-like protein